MGIGGFGECLPYHDNKMTLDYDKLDDWGLPTITFDAEWKENEYKMIRENKLIPYLIDSIKTLKNRITQIKNANNK